MNTLEKIKTLGEAAKYDICASTSCSPTAVTRSRRGEERIGSLTNGGICHSFTPDGRCVSLFKVLMSNQCSGDCKYCVNNCEVKTTRTSFEPEELKNTFLKLYHGNYVEGLFLSSAVRRDAEWTEEGLLEVVEQLRYKDGFSGYVHLKIMPGVSRDMIKRATEVADRVSLNLEAPNRLRFQEITSTKDYKLDLIRRMRWTQRELDEKSSGQTTQFVVGACEENDYELLSTINDLYKKIELKRSYFSAFIPVPGTGLEGSTRTPLMREHRLYQCDFLMRKYGFKLDEFVLEDDDFLDLRRDPKMAIAMQNPEYFPIEINEASYGDLLKVPGIGPQSATRIANLTKNGFKFTNLRQLRNLGIVMKRARSFISIGGEYQSSLRAFQNAPAT